MLSFSRCLIAILALTLAQPASAKVVVLANRTVQAITIDLDRQRGSGDSVTIPSGDSLPVYFQNRLSVSYGQGLRRQRFPLQPSTAYFFTRTPNEGRLHLEQIGLGEKPATSPSATIPSSNASPPPETVTINVKVLADDNEPTHRRIWEPKLRRRVAEASKILERQSGIRLNIVEVTTWDSDESRRHFVHTLREFELEVKPQPAELAIGFSSQYEAQRSRSHLGVTRWPMHSHVLIRERSQNLLESERVELLVHELGHYLGASHSPEPNSVMRPRLTRGLQRGVGSRITFDPVNALIIAIMGEEIRTHGTRDIRQISEPTRERLREIYSVLVKAMPEDPAARQYLRLLDIKARSVPVVVARRPQPKPNADPSETPRITPLARDTQKILQELVAFAESHEMGGEVAADISGDELTNMYVRRAARAASQLRSSNAKRAMLLALGIFVDDNVFLREFPATGRFVKQAEPSESRIKRLEVLGKPTMRERLDLTKHFFVSGHLHVAIGKTAAVASGLAKEMSDSQGGTGFSFIDMAANRAGIIFAENVLSDKLELQRIAEEFHVDDYLPTLRGLEEGLQAEQLNEQYGGEGQPTINEVLEGIEERVLSLPAYDEI